MASVPSLHNKYGRSVIESNVSCYCPVDINLRYLSSFQPVLHDWCNKGSGMCYPVCGMMHIKQPLLLIGKCSLCGVSGFLL